MCEFCENNNNGWMLGKDIDIQEWYSKTNLRTARIVTHKSSGKPCIAIRSSRMTKGSFFINYCPMCGRKLNDKYRSDHTE